MKFVTSSSVLGAKLAAIGKVINSKNAMPILGDIVFEVRSSELHLMASDSEIWMQTSMELTEADGDGLFCINAHDITKAVKDLSEQPLTFNVDKQKRAVKITYLNGQFSLPIEEVDEFPNPTEISGDTLKSIDKGLFIECITRAHFSCAQDELRPVMNGEYIDFTKDFLTIVASDGHKLVLNKLNGIKSDTAGSFIMPKKVVGLLRSTLSRGAGDVMVHFDSRNARLTYDGTTITFRLIDGRYPNYNSVIPKDNPNTARVERVALLQALKHVINFSSISNFLVRFHFADGTIKLDAEDYDFSKTATETVKCEYDGSAISIGFKGSAFVEILSNYICHEIVIKLSSPTRAAIIVPSEQREDCEVVMLIMPMC